jgi:hypothetical protein
MIPDSWLKERLQTSDVQELSKRELMRLGLSDSDFRELLARGPSPQWVEKWGAFLSQMGAGDELWFFESPPERWSGLAGATGYALVRAGRIIDTIATRRS